MDFDNFDDFCYTSTDTDICRLYIMSNAPLKSIVVTIFLKLVKIDTCN